MFKRIIYLTALAAFLTAFTLLSCEKEKVMPDDGTTEQNPVLDISNYTEEGESDDIQPLPLDFIVAPCYKFGKVITVYNPDVLDLDYYDEERYTITWFRNGIAIASGYETQCLCGGNVLVKVIDRRTSAQGVASIRVRGCHTPKLHPLTQ